MSKPFPLQTVADLMQTRADDAAVALGKLLAQEKDARARLQLLEDYRAEYLSRFQQAAAQGLSAAQWANYQEFIGRIDEAIGQQRRVVETSSGQTQAGQQHWLKQRNKAQAFDTLAQQHEAEQRYQEGRKEQKQGDEFSARKHFHDPDRD